MNSRFIHGISARLKTICLELVAVSYTSGGHLRLLVRDPATDLDAFVICSATPSCWRAAANVVRDAKAALNPTGTIQTRKANFAAVAL